jgi:hypothetical protein
MKYISKLFLLYFILLLYSSCVKDASQDFEYIDISTFKNILNINQVQEALGICKNNNLTIYTKNIDALNNKIFTVNLSCGKTVIVKPLDFKFDINKQQNKEGILLYSTKEKNHKLELSFLNLSNNGNDVFVINKNGKIIKHKQGSF